MFIKATNIGATCDHPLAIGITSEGFITRWVAATQRSAQVQRIRRYYCISVNQIDY